MKNDVSIIRREKNKTTILGSLRTYWLMVLSAGLLLPLPLRTNTQKKPLPSIKQLRERLLHDGKMIGFIMATRIKSIEVDLLPLLILLQTFSVTSYAWCPPCGYLRRGPVTDHSFAVTGVCVGVGGGADIWRYLSV